MHGLGLILMLTVTADPEVMISQASKTEQGWLRHTITSPYQAGITEIRVLLPVMSEPAFLPVIYVLPVEAGREERYGDGLTEILSLPDDVRQQAIFVAPTFSHLPWYADHTSDLEIRQETYLLKVVVPFVERTYPVVRERRGRLLLGFSKSGWGAWSLLLRHPETFERAVAWDAPLMMSAPGKYGSGPIFGDQTNFDRYQVSDLLQEQTHSVGTSSRLILLGYGNFRDEHVQTQKLLEELRIPHVYRDGPKREHTWHSGWVAEGVALLLAREATSGKP